MTTRGNLTSELYDLRRKYKDAPENEKAAIEARGKEINKILRSMCYQCGNEPRTYNEYYCSKACNDLYYPEKKGRKSIEHIKAELKEMAKLKHITK